MPFPPQLSDIDVWNAEASEVESGGLSEEEVQDIVDSSTAGAARVLGPFPFAFDDVGLEDGIAFYTPTVGDILLDAWIEVTEAFDGATPLADLGTFDGSTTGLLAQWFGPFDLTTTSEESAGAGISFSDTSAADPTSFVTGPVSAFNVSISGGNLLYLRAMPARFTATHPVKIVASQDGEAGGTAVGGTAGAGAVYLVVATPSLA